MVAILVWLGLLVAGIGVVVFVEVREFHRLSRSIVGSMNRPTRRVGLLSLVPGVGTTAWLVVRGVDLPTGLIVGFASALGVFAVLLAILKMEGMLLETASEAALRMAQGLPPPSSAMGRLVAAAAGIVALGLGAYAISLVTR